MTGASGGGNRPDLLGNQCLPSNGPRGEEIAQWVNPSAFAAPAPCTFGSTSPTLNKNFDITVGKPIPIRETVTAEFFNAVNRPQCQASNMTFGSASFGPVTVQENVPRVIQAALKIRFWTGGVDGRTTQDSSAARWRVEIAYTQTRGQMRNLPSEVGSADRASHQTE